MHGYGAPEHLEPVLTPGGVIAAPIDWASVQLVWNGETGFPAHPVYRDYHRRTVHDLRPWSNGGEPYCPEQAAALAREHARAFVERCIGRLDAYAAERGRPGLLTFALDTELLGHWWYEGQTWLRAVFAEASAQGLRLATVSEALEEIEPVEREPAVSSWGAGKDFSTWDSPKVAEMAFAARGAELRTVAAAAGGAHSPDALARAARELLALQSSDWAFQETNDLASDYPGAAWPDTWPGTTKLSVLWQTPRPCRPPHCATWRPTSRRLRYWPRERPSAHPLVGVPPANRGRARAPRAKARGGSRRSGRSGARAGPRPRGGSRRGGGRGRDGAPGARARAPARPH